METKVIKNLSNEEYHHSTEYSEYVSSSQLRKYLTSPADFKRSLETPTESTPAMELGSLVHDALEYVHNTGDFSLSSWSESKAVFTPPINPTTGSAYGAATKKYQEAYQDFLQTTDGKQIVSKENLDIAHAIARSIENDATMSRVILKGEAEVSMFLEDGLFKCKVRPDLYNNTQLWDHKTINGPLDEQSLVKRILDSHYHTQLAMYQYVIHEVTGKWLKPYIAFYQTCEPYGVQVVSLNHFCYSVEDGMMVNDQNLGALEFQMLKDLHVHCMETDEWQGSNIFVKPDTSGRRILEPEVPAYATYKLQQFYI